MVSVKVMLMMIMMMMMIRCVNCGIKFMFKIYDKSVSHDDDDDDDETCELWDQAYVQNI